MSKAPDMVERVAQVLHDRDKRISDCIGHGLAAWGNTPPAAKEAWLSEARAAIKAMREPTEAMLIDDRPAEKWRAMIDAALEPPSE